MGAALRGRAPGRAAGPLRCPAADRPGFGRCDGLMPAARLTPPRSGGPSSAERLLAQIRIPDADRIRGSISLPLTLPGAPDVPVTWSSSAPEIISERTINGVAPGVVRRPPAGGEPADVRLVAYVHLPHGVLQREFRVTVLPAIELARTSRYAMVNFARSNSHEGQQLYFAVWEGDDPTSWQAVNSGRAVLEATAGMRAVRDPSIVRPPEGDRFFLVVTDLNVDARERGWRGWAGWQRGRSRSLREGVGWGAERGEPIPGGVGVERPAYVVRAVPRPGRACGGGDGLRAGGRLGTRARFFRRHLDLLPLPAGQPLQRRSSRGVSLCSESSRENGRLGGRGGGRWLVVGAVAEHREDDVGSATGQADHGSVVALALGAFAVVVGLGDRVVVRGDPSRVEQRVLQPLIARSGRELTTDRGAGSSRDRRDPGIGRKMAWGLERGAVADVQEDLGGGLDADPRHAHQDRGEREVLQHGLDLPRHG